MFGNPADFLLPIATHVVLTSCKATLAIAFLLLCRKLFADRLCVQARRGSWLAVLVALLLPVGFDIPIAVRANPPVTAAAAVGAELLAPDIAAPASAVPSQPDVATRGTVPRFEAGNPPSRSIPIQSWLLLLWATGVVVLAAVPLFNLHRYRRIAARAIPVSGAAADLLLQCRTQMGVRRAVRLIESAEVTTPAIFGRRSPTLLLPPGLRQQLDATQLRHVFLHELAHVQRHDILVNWIATAAQILHWFNPLVWYGLRVMRSDMEQACDATVLGHLSPQEHAEYGRTLIGVLDAFPGPVPTQGLGVIESHAQLKERIRMIAKFSSRRVSSPILQVFLGFTLTAAAAVQPQIGSRATTSPDKTMSAAPAPIATAPQAEAARPAPSPPSSPPPAAQRRANPAPVAAAVIPFTVRLGPAYTDGVDASVKTLLDDYFLAVAARLRAIPGLTLVTPESPVNEGETINYDIAIARIDYGPGGAQVLGLFARQRSRPATDTSGRWARYRELYSGGYIPSVLSADFNDPQRTLDRDIEQIRMTLFPPDVSLDEKLWARLLDPRMESSLRQDALRLLLMLGPAPDPAAMRRGLELVQKVDDPGLRTQIWGRLGEAGSPEITAPLTQALATERDEDVRLFLVTLVAAYHAAEPRIRTALEAVAKSDPRPVTRMAAQRALAGTTGGNESTWNDYVLATLKNSGLTDAQRLDPLAYQGVRLEFKLPVDDESLRILGSLLKKAKSETYAARGAMYVLDTANGPVAREVTMDLVRAGEGQPLAIREVREHELQMLFAANRSDPAVRALVADIAAHDPDPQMRSKALQILE